jgi:hypothetical protein
VVAFRRAKSRSASRHVRDVEVHDVPSPEVDASATIAAVADLLDALMPAAMLPLDDQALWLSSQLAGLTARLAGASGEAIDYALDKSRQLEAASCADLCVPSTQVLGDLKDVGPISFRVMVKPARALYEVHGALQRPAGVISADGEELARAVARPWPGSLLVQALIQGTGKGLFGYVGRRVSLAGVPT